MTEYIRRRKAEGKLAYAALMKFYPLTLDDLLGEIWQIIPNHENYQISNFGRAKSSKCRVSRILKPRISNIGYLYVNLCEGGKAKNFGIHQLVAKLFLPNPEGKPQVNHIDGHPLNNHVSNLEWVTGSENARHAVKTGLTPQGEERPESKLTNEQIQYIRANPNSLTLTQLAEKFGVAFQTISDIQLGRSWKEAGGIIRDKIDWRTPDDVRAKIRAEYIYGSAEFGCYGLAKKYGVNPTTISRIVHEKERRRLS